MSALTQCAQNTLQKDQTACVSTTCVEVYKCASTSSVHCPSLIAVIVDSESIYDLFSNGQRAAAGKGKDNDGPTSKRALKKKDKKDSGSIRVLPTGEMTNLTAHHFDIQDRAGLLSKLSSALNSRAVGSTKVSYLLFACAQYSYLRVSPAVQCRVFTQPHCASAESEANDGAWR